MVRKKSNIISILTIIILASIIPSCASHTSRDTGILRLSNIDSTYERLEEKLYVRAIRNDSTELGEIFIYTVNEQSELEEIQHIDSLLTASRLFGVRAYQDYNNDGRKDLLVAYGTGARGSNTLNYLFVQRKLTDDKVGFEYVRGCSDAPNLYVNTATGIIESTRYHGGVTFVDYKIIGDSLVEQGGTEVTGNDKWVIRIHYKIDSTGQQVELRRDSVYDGYDNFYIR